MMDAVNKATRDATDDVTWYVTRDAMGVTTFDRSYYATDVATDIATHKATKAAPDDATWDATDYALRRARGHECKNRT